MDRPATSLGNYSLTSPSGGSGDLYSLDNTSDLTHGASVVLLNSHHVDCKLSLLCIALASCTLLGKKHTYSLYSELVCHSSFSTNIVE